MSFKTSQLKAVPIRLEEFKASESPAKEIQVLKTGTFTHPEYGTFSITKEMLLSMKKNFDEKVRGIDIAVDYQHDSESVAAGWIKELRLSNDGESLWATVDWTPNGKKVLSDKEFRYISADFMTEYQDNQSLKTYGPTLLGAGLTNRPVIKRMAPTVELSEKGSENMDQKDKEIESLKAEIAQLKAGTAKAEKALETATAQLSESVAALKKIEDEKKIAVEEKAKAEKESLFTKMLSEKKAVAAQKEAFMAGDMIKFAELAAPVHTSPAGHSGAGNTESDDSADKQILKLAEEKVSKKECKDIGEAISKVRKENPKLREAADKKFSV